MTGAQIVDVELPERLRSVKVTFFRHKMAKTELKKYPLFNDYDEFGKLVPVITKNIPYEIISVNCGENF